MIENYVEYKDGDLYWRTRSGNSVPGSRAGRTTNTGHRQVSIQGKLYPVSHVVWYLNKGFWPTQMLDHVDRNPNNNSLENLRECNHKLNGANRTKGNCGYKGLQFYPEKKNPWRVTVGNKYVGYFKTEAEAKAAYLDEAKALYGDFATHGEDH